MSENEPQHGKQKIALLDTDFVVKTIMSKKDSNHNLMNLLMQYSDYEFVCHEKTIEEIKDHDFSGAFSWVMSKVDSGVIRVYSDRDIIELLSSLYGNGAIAQYTYLLKTSCTAFSRTKYQDNYSEIAILSPTVKIDEFLKKLRGCDMAFGRGNGLGEIKLLILLQALNIIHPGDVSAFCSDDRGARRGVFSLASVPCISIITLFCHLKTWGVIKDEAEPYYRSYINGLPPTQTTFKVYHKPHFDFIAVSCDEIFDNIYNDRYDAYATGILIEK